MIVWDARLAARSVQNAKEGWIPAFLIMVYYNYFVHCFIWLNKQCRAFIGVSETCFVEAPVSAFELDIAEQANMLDTG